MTEVEILEALVKSKNMSDTLASPQAQQDVAAAARNIPDNAWVSDANSDGENEGKDKQLLSGDQRNVKNRTSNLTVVEEVADGAEARKSTAHRRNSSDAEETEDNVTK